MPFCADLCPLFKETFYKCTPRNSDSVNSNFHFISKPSGVPNINVIYKFLVRTQLSTIQIFTEKFTEYLELYSSRDVVRNVLGKKKRPQCMERFRL